MPRHDYDLPPDWGAMSDAEKCRWLTQERARRQSRRQATATTARADKQAERTTRKLEARGYEPLRMNR